MIRVLRRKVNICEGQSDSVLQRKVNICEGQSNSVLQRKVCEGQSDSVLQRKVNICEGQGDRVLQRRINICEGQSDRVLQRKVNICEGQGDKGPSEKGTHIWWTGRLGFRERCTCCLYRTGGLGSLIKSNMWVGQENYHPSNKGTWKGQKDKRPSQKATQEDQEVTVLQIKLCGFKDRNDRNVCVKDRKIGFLRRKDIEGTEIKGRICCFLCFLYTERYVKWTEHKINAKKKR